MNVSVREVRRDDLSAIAVIERASFSDPWSRAMFDAHLMVRGGNLFLVAESGAALVGYAIVRTVHEESELLNIAIAPERRNQGIGAQLLDEVIRRCRASGALEMWLEVRESNVGARALYAARGFTAAGIRKRYYHAPREDAIVLRAAIGVDVRSETVTQPVQGLHAGSVDSIISTASHHPRQETK